MHVSQWGSVCGLDPLFLSGGTGYWTELNSMSCTPGVAQVLNRLDGKPFDDADQRLFEVPE